MPQDPSDSYQRRGIRTAWGQEWAGGLSSRAQISINKRHYQGANLTSGGQIRHDKQMQSVFIALAQRHSQMGHHATADHQHKHQ